MPDAFDDAADFERYDLTRRIKVLKNTDVRIVCGTKDPFFENDRFFANLLRARGIHAQVALSAGYHDDAFWQRTAPRDLEFLLEAVG